MSGNVYVSKRSQQHLSAQKPRQATVCYKLEVRGAVSKSVPLFHCPLGAAAGMPVTLPWGQNLPMVEVTLLCGD